MNLILAALLLAASAQECPPGTNSIERDRELVQANAGVEYLGVHALPYMKYNVVLYHDKATDFTHYSPIISGCVPEQTFILGPFKAMNRA